MKTLPIIFVWLLCAQWTYSQSGTPPIPRSAYCVRTKSLARKDLKNEFPFNKATKIQFVSFKPDKESMPMIDGVIDTAKFIEVKTLKRKQEDKLIDILYNYNFDPKISRDSIVLEEMVCYEPRNAIIFKNERKEIVSYLEICFECLKHRRPSDLHLGDFCQDKYALLKSYFEQMGIKFGIMVQE